MDTTSSMQYRTLLEAEMLAVSTAVNNTSPGGWNLDLSSLIQHVLQANAFTVRTEEHSDLKEVVLRL